MLLFDWEYLTFTLSVRCQQITAKVNGHSCTVIHSGLSSIYLLHSSKQNSLFFFIANSSWFLSKKIIRKIYMSLTFTNWKVRTIMIFRWMAIMYIIWKLVIYVKKMALEPQHSPVQLCLTVSLISWWTFTKIAELYTAND